MNEKEKGPAPRKSILERKPRIEPGMVFTKGGNSEGEKIVFKTSEQASKVPTEPHKPTSGPRFNAVASARRWFGSWSKRPKARP